MADFKVAIDAGHGGSDPGAVFGNRREKDDVLALAFAVGDILRKSGVDVFYVRNDDTYETPFKKATDANNSGADILVSLHRNSSEEPGQYSGVESLIFANGGTREQLAKNINANLEEVGFKNLGVDLRPNLVVLKRSKMPAVLVEVGFINNKEDNALYDEKFNQIAQGIADGILQTLYQQANVTSVASMNTVESVVNENAWGGSGAYNTDNGMMNGNGMNTDNGMNGNGMNTDNGMMNGNGMNTDNSMMNGNGINTDNSMMRGATDGPMDMVDERSCSCGEKLYRVQVGAYRNKESADRLLNSLLIEGFPAYIVYENNLYKVQVGAYRFLANAIKMEERLRRFRYNTYITT